MIPKFYVPLAGGTMSFSSGWDDYNAKFGELPRRVGVEVRNFGVAVSISEVGFYRKGDRSGRFPILHQFPAHAIQFDKRLEPHESVTFYANDVPQNFDKQKRHPFRAYATTASGKTFRGNSEIFKSYVLHVQLQKQLSDAMRHFKARKEDEF